MITNTIQNLADTIGGFLQTDQQSIDWETKPAPGKWSKRK
jgi:hypothetical protein